jgi:hypothetical protein
MAADTATDAVATPDRGTPTPSATPPERQQAGPSQDARRARGRGLLPTLRLIVAPFVVTLTVMLIGIGERQLWRDENATWWAASLSLGDLRKLVESSLLSVERFLEVCCIKLDRFPWIGLYYFSFGIKRSLLFWCWNSSALG